MADDHSGPPPHHHIHEIRSRLYYRYCRFCQRHACYATSFRDYLYSYEWINRLELIFEDKIRPVEGIHICVIQRHLFHIFLFENNYIRPRRGQRVVSISLYVSKIINDIYPRDKGSYIGFRTHISNRVQAVNVDGEVIKKHVLQP